MKIAALILLATLCLPHLTYAEATPPSKEILTWVRAEGLHSDGRLVKPKFQTKLSTEGVKKTIKKTTDVQYKKTIEISALTLKELISHAKRNIPAKHFSSENLALLHFANNMIVPIPLDDSNATNGLWFAEKIKMKNRWSSAFPDVSKPHDKLRDPRPIQFAANKIVSSNLAYPYAPKKINKTSKETFSPWQHVSSLTGIEFVNEAAYYLQFRSAKNLDQGAGLEVFQQRCQFCHGIRQVGAKFGWDYLDPLPIYELKHPQHVFHKVTVPLHDAMERGLMMPRQKSVEKGEIYILWGWLKQLDRQKDLMPYRLIN